MCRIAVKRKPTSNKMLHGGEYVHTENSGDLDLIHTWLPIQTDPKTTPTPIISTEGKKILFNGEFFGHSYTDDLKMIEDLCNKYQLFNYIANEADGFWSMIIVDHASIVAFTDPLGKKQLYYKEGFGIASEIRELVEDNEPVDKLYLAHTIKFGYVTDNSTPYRFIKRIIPNRLHHFDRQLNLTKVCTQNMVNMEPKLLGLNDFLEKMDLAVKNRLIGKRKVGLLLSGGLDSSIIHYHLADQNVSSYSVDNLDDLKYAQMIDNKVMMLETIPTSIDGALHAMEMPLDLGSMVPQYMLMNTVSETVVLTGDGADEVFGGYNRMKDYDAQYSDVFDEIPYYHNIRLDRMASWFTKEIRSPFLHLDIVRHGLALPYHYRIDKAWLRLAYAGLLPEEILRRKKIPLKTDNIRSVDPILYRTDLVKRLLNV